MSLNWVMLDTNDPKAFTPLPYEETLYSSPPRTTLTLSSPNPFPAAKPFSIPATPGRLHLTNQRIVFLPNSRPASPAAAPSTSLSASQSGFQSFAAPLLNLENSHLSIPWLGPNVWTVLVKPVPGGGLPTAHERLQLKITFRDGGAADFQPKFERIKERVMHAAEMARDSGRANDETPGVATGPDGLPPLLVHLDDLPAYPGTPPTTLPSAIDDRDPGEGGTSRNGTQRQLQQPPLPDGPPPGYDEVQRQVIEDEFGRRLEAARLQDDR